MWKLKRLIKYTAIITIEITLSDPTFFIVTHVTTSITYSYRTKTQILLTIHWESLSLGEVRETVVSVGGIAHRGLLLERNRMLSGVNVMLLTIVFKTLSRVVVVAAVVVMTISQRKWWRCVQVTNAQTP